MRRLPFTATYNLRELGGIGVDTYQETKYHQFLRSDSLVNLSEEEIKFLSSYDLKLVIDLRNDKEIIKHPNVLAEHPNFIYKRVPFLNNIVMHDKENQMAKDLYSRSLNDIYISIISSYKEMKEIFTLFEQYRNNCILFHCSAGKDRTGVITFLLLKLAGVSDLDIIADYEVSYTYLMPRTLMLKEKYPDMKMHIMDSNREVMQEFMDYFYAKYETVENYLLKIGINEKSQNIIKNKLI